MTKKEETSEIKKEKKEEEKKKALAVSQAEAEEKKKLDRLPMLERDIIKLICLYSLMEARMIGPIIAKLMSEFEGVEFNYYELLADRILDINDDYLFSKKSVKEKKPLNQYCQYVVAKKGVMNNYYDRDKTVSQMERENDALIFHESPAPIRRIPFFSSYDYLSKIQKYSKYPYVLDFFDYVISKKAKLRKYDTDKFPIYSEFELYTYLREYLEINLFKIREKEQMTEIVKKFILTRDIA